MHTCAQITGDDGYIAMTHGKGSVSLTQEECSRCCYPLSDPLQVQDCIKEVDSWKQRNKMPCYQCKEIINDAIVYIFGTTGLVVTWEKLFAGMLMAA